MVKPSSTLQKRWTITAKRKKKKLSNLYKEFLDEGGKDKRAYTNLAALLRTKGNAEEAMKIVNIGLREWEKIHQSFKYPGQLLTRFKSKLRSHCCLQKSAIKFHKGYFDPQISLLEHCTIWD